MKLSIDSFSFHLHFGRHWFKPSVNYDLKWYCNKSRELGVDGIHVDPCHIDLQKDLSWLKDYLVKHSMFIELGGSGSSIQNLAPQIAAAKKLGSKILRTFIRGDCSAGRKESAKNAMRAKKELSESVKLAEDEGVIIAVEDHLDVFLDDMRRLMEIDSPYLGICYDSGNFAAVGEDPVNALRVLLERVVCTHLKDYCLPEKYADAIPFGLTGNKYHFCALGDGLLPVEQIVDILLSSKGKNTHVTIEIHTPLRKSIGEKELLDFEMNNATKSINIAKKIGEKYSKLSE